MAQAVQMQRDGVHDGSRGFDGESQRMLRVILADLITQQTHERQLSIAQPLQKVRMSNSWLRR